VASGDTDPPSPAVIVKVYCARAGSSTSAASFKQAKRRKN
tara:strand:+ start:1686 stop:1805 length:120 start_codon:yes stop_codon:yes gene_type:complete